jgi:adenylosuccinate synthase
VLDLRHPEQLRSRVERGVAHANAQLTSFGVTERADLEATLQALARITPRILPITDDVGFAIHRAIKTGARVLLEGAQGSMLDVDHGTYPFVTSSSTTSGGAAIGVGIAPNLIHASLGIVKAYTTRVGNGPLPTELEEPLASRIRELGKEFGATTGRPRRCGWFDSVVVRYATRINGLTGIAVTKLDVLDTLDRIALCTGYLIDGDLFTEFPGDLVALERAQPQYEWLEGWQQSTADARTRDELPPQARVYLQRIEALVDAPIKYISVGTRRDQIIGA